MVQGSREPAQRLRGARACVSGGSCHETIAEAKQCALSETQPGCHEERNCLIVPPSHAVSHRFFVACESPPLSGHERNTPCILAYGPLTRFPSSSPSFYPLSHFSLSLSLGSSHVSPADLNLIAWPGRKRQPILLERPARSVVDLAAPHRLSCPTRQTRLPSPLLPTPAGDHRASPEKGWPAEPSRSVLASSQNRNHAHGPSSSSP
ncbi:hypothetical protein J3F83DRAFT_440410 [Trichoderma novae-zelandiae]